jgi:P2-related tail formation protein
MIIVDQWNSFWDSDEKKVMVNNSININKTKESLNSVFRLLPPLKLVAMI